MSSGRVVPETALNHYTTEKYFAIDSEISRAHSVLKGLKSF